jgi:hypothetical protein
VDGYCLNQGPCGNKPCTGGVGCPDGPPANFQAIVTGQSSIALTWDDPVNSLMVDQYNVYYTLSTSSTSCASLSVGATCSFTVPGEPTPRTGRCGMYGTGTSKYCWLDLIPQLLAVLPCVKQSALDTSCNYQDVAAGVVVGR